MSPQFKRTLGMVMVIDAVVSLVISAVTALTGSTGTFVNSIGEAATNG
jgi:hypothetical protein